jgi:anti-repressor protein
MNELFNVTTNGDKLTLSARDLHNQLQIHTKFNDWFSRMKEYGFDEGTDFYSFLSESTGGRPATDYQITLDMAKEIAMLQRNEKGKQIRKKLIELEKAWNSPEKVMARALDIAHKTIANLQIENEEMKPKALFADTVAASDSSILVGQEAKLISQSGCKMGQNRFFAWLRENGYLCSKGENYNMPTQKSREMDLIEIKIRTVTNPDGSVRETKTPVITGKGQIYFINKFKNA